MTAQHFLQKRFSALMAENYDAVYASYHEDAPFIHQFSDRQAYLHFARQQLKAIVINDWRCLRQRNLDGKKLEVILVMEVAVDDKPQYFYELALLVETDEGWCYHSAQKLTMEDYSGSPDLIDFCHFDNANPKIRF